MDSFTLLMAAVRGVQLAALLSLFGTLVFTAVLAPVAVWERLARLAKWSAVVAFVAAASWLMLEASAISGASSPAETLAALPTVVIDTRFGEFVAIRLALLLCAFLLAGARGIGLVVAVVLSAAAVALQSAIGHVGAVGGGLGAGLVVSESLHLLAAGAWLGGLLPLLLSLRVLPPPAAADVCERFTPVGLAAVLVIAATALIQGLQLIGSIPALFGTQYGHIALLKAGLFAVALAFAARNRLSLTDRLSGASPEHARRQLRRSIAGETGVGLAIVLAAAVLASSSPGAHAQPVWPFPWRFSLTATSDPDLRQEVIVASAIIATGLLILVASLILRRMRIAAFVLAIGLIAWRGPSLTVLLVEAYPTSFFTSPTRFAVMAIMHGQALFAANCASCHGGTGQGDGPAARGLRVHPADLTAPHLWEHSDGELYWWIGHGIEDPEGGLAMPGFAAILSAGDRWDLIDYVRANNAGIEARTAGGWAQPIPAPDLPIQCGSLTADQASDLKGRAVIVVADAPAATAPGVPEVPPQDGVPIVVLHLGHVPPGNDCVADTPDAWPAYALLTGVSPDRLAGTVVLVDPNGWMRAIYPPDGTQDASQLIASLRAICEHPVSALSGGGHEHHH